MSRSRHPSLRNPTAPATGRHGSQQPPGHRWGEGSGSVLEQLLNDALRRPSAGPRTNGGASARPSNN